MSAARQAVLIVEDEQAIADTIVYALQTEGFLPVWKSTLGGARDALKEGSFALVILDVGLPDGNGFDFCREIRGQHRMPIIFLTARSGEVDRIVGLELGGDDYVAKPFSPRELTARVRAVLRRGSPASTGASGATVPADAGVWAHDADRCLIRYKGRPLDLTRNEYRLILVLLGQPGRVFSREQLMNAAWDDPGAALDRTVDAHVKSLRSKLRTVAPEADPIVTHRGLGYSLREES